MFRPSVVPCVCIFYVKHVGTASIRKRISLPTVVMDGCLFEECLCVQTDLINQSLKLNVPREEKPAGGVLATPCW